MSKRNGSSKASNRSVKLAAATAATPTQAPTNSSADKFGCVINVGDVIGVEGALDGGTVIEINGGTVYFRRYDSTTETASTHRVHLLASRPTAGRAPSPSRPTITVDEIEVSSDETGYIYTHPDAMLKRIRAALVPIANLDADLSDHFNGIDHVTRRQCISLLRAATKELQELAGEVAILSPADCQRGASEGKQGHDWTAGLEEAKPAA